MEALHCRLTQCLWSSHHHGLPNRSKMDKDERGMTVSLTDADNKYICAADYS